MRLAIPADNQRGNHRHMSGASHTNPLKKMCIEYFSCCTTKNSYRALLQYTNHSYISYSIFFTDFSLPLPACLSWCTPNPFFWHTDAHVPPPSSVHSPHPPLPGALMYTFWCTPPSFGCTLPPTFWYTTVHLVYTFSLLMRLWCIFPIWFTWP